VSERAGRQRTQIYLDHAATTWPRPPRVLDAVTRAFTEFGGSPGRGAYELAIRSGRALAESRATLASFLGVADPHDLAFVSSCTAGCNLMLKGLLRPGDRVVVGSMEHNAVTRPLGTLVAAGVIVDIVSADETGFVDPDAVERAVRSAPTRAVVCQHASNLTGTIQALGDLADIAHASGAVMLADGAQAVGHVAVDIGALGVDAYAISGHKGLLGVPGSGLLYLSPAIDPDPLVEGGTGVHAADHDRMPPERPERYEAGSADVPGAVGMAEGARMLVELGPEHHILTAALTRRLHEGLLELEMRVLGPEPGVERVPVVSVVPPGGDADRLAFELDRTAGIACRSGLHCAPWAHRSCSSEGTGAVRFSLGWDSEQAHVDALLEAIRALTG
jgi:selenocysteine lyase/cysteine desulfurase